MERPVFRLSLLHPRYWLLWLGLAFWWLISQLPYAVLVWIAKAITPLLLKFGRSRQAIVETNLRVCFPALSVEERDQLLRDNFFSMSMALLETGMVWFWPQWRLRRLCHVEGMENLQAQSEHGVLLMAMHFTHLDLGGGMLSMFTPICGMYRTHKNPVYDYVQRRGRERHNEGSTVIQREDIRGMLRLLKGKRAVWYAPDQDYGRKNSVFVPFFGVNAATVTATANFARLGKAKIVPFVQTRLANNRGYKITIYPAFDDFPTGDAEADARTVNEFIEARILEQPEQYLWAHRRFKTRPEGDASIY